MKKLTLIFVSILALLFFSCRDDFKFDPSTGNLAFSKDTIYLDTVFTNIGSSTYRLKVYNNSNKDINIPSVRLAKGENSEYRLMVDGNSGKIFNNVEILAKDSLFIFIETTIDYDKYKNSTAEYLYTDKIEFDYESNYQKVELVTLVKDAYFLYPKKYDDNTYENIIIDDEATYGFVLDENDAINGNELLWKNNKPYVIYGYALVPENKTLEVEEGAQIHFHNNSGLIVADKGQLHINGTLEKPITFMSDRLESGFNNISGQWGAIWLTPGSSGKIKNTVIKNATVGLLIENNLEPVDLYNVQIYNCTHYGISASNATIKGENVVTNNLGIAALNISSGGKYNFNHCTFANFGALGSTTCVFIDNTKANEGYVLEEANFNNSILFGSTSSSITLVNTVGQPFNFNFSNSLIRYYDYGQSDSQNLYPLKNTTNYIDNVIAKNSNTLVDFKNSSSNVNNLIIGEKSAAIGISNSVQNSGYDILGNVRPAINADAGAYNHTIFETEK